MNKVITIVMVIMILCFTVLALNFAYNKGYDRGKANGFVLRGVADEGETNKYYGVYTMLVSIKELDTGKETLMIERVICDATVEAGLMENFFVEDNLETIIKIKFLNYEND